MIRGDMPPMFGPSAMHEPSTHEPRAGKCVLTSNLVKEIAGKGRFPVVFGPPRVGMSMRYQTLRLTGAEAAKLIDSD